MQSSIRRDDNASKGFLRHISRIMLTDCQPLFKYRPCCIIPVCFWLGQKIVIGVLWLRRLSRNTTVEVQLRTWSEWLSFGVHLSQGGNYERWSWCALVWALDFRYTFFSPNFSWNYSMWPAEVANMEKYTICVGDIYLFVNCLNALFR